MIRAAMEIPVSTYVLSTYRITSGRARIRSEAGLSVVKRASPS